MKKKHIINILVVLAISILITFAWDGFSGGVRSIILNILYGLLIGLSFAFGASFIAAVVFKKFDITVSPGKIYLLLVFSIILFMALDALLINAIWFNLTQGYSLSAFLKTKFGLQIILIQVVLGWLIFMIILSLKFIRRLRDAEHEIQETQQEALKYQYETLKNQINPHFLFNSLGNLNALIVADPQKAQQFTQKLAHIYRYVLDSQAKKLVKVEEETEFIENYSYLLSIRHNNNFKLELIYHNRSQERLIIPMSLQLIVENVLQHNVVSSDKPMSVKMTFEDDYVEIRNTKNLKQKQTKSHGIGQTNIAKQYKWFTDKTCVFEETNREYIVRLPLLETQN